MALKNTGLIIFIELLRANRDMEKEYKEERDDLLERILQGSLVIGSQETRRQIEERFTKIFNKYFIAGLDASKLLVDKEVTLLTNTLEVPFKYNKDVIDLVNNQSVFKGFQDQLYKDRFTKGEIDRIKRVLLSGTYSNKDEKLLRDELQKSFNLTKKRAQLLARDETKRLRETTKTVYYQQAEVQKNYELVWDAVVDDATRDPHLELDGQVADSKGYFQSPTFGRVISPPLSYNCRCSTFFRKKHK